MKTWITGNRVLAGISCAGILAVLTGCSTTPVDMNAIAKEFYAQERTYSVIKLTGVNEIMVTGNDMTIQMDSQLPALSMIPRDPGTLEKIAPILASLGQIGLAGYGIYQASEVMKDLSTTRDPLVVRPEIVNPVIVGP